MLPSSAIRVACSRVSSRFGAAKITPASTTRATRMICQRGRLTIGREAFGLAVEAPAGRQGPRLGSGLVVGLAAEAEQSVQQALRLGRRHAVGGPRTATAPPGAAVLVGDGVTDDPHRHPLPQLAPETGPDRPQPDHPPERDDPAPPPHPTPNDP